MQKGGNFCPQVPKLGLERQLFSNIKINIYDEVDESDKFDESHIDNSFIENILNINNENINKYKNEGVYCIYDEKTFDNYTNLINFQTLMEILTYDETSYDNFIIEGKGKWIENISECNFNGINKEKKITDDQIIINNDLQDNFNDKNDNKLNNNQMTNNFNYDRNNIDNKTNSLENYFSDDSKVTKQDLFKDQNFSLEFESRFESGNLRMALQISENEYDLILKNDINSGKTSNWFFFRVTIKNLKNIKFSENPQTIKFNIINLQKVDTLFSKGLKVLYFNESQNRWYRKTKNNYYYSNSLSIEEKKLSTLTFSIEINDDFTEENLFFSYCYPYTYSYLQNYLRNIFNNQTLIQKNVVRHEIIGKSLAGNNLDMIIITNFTTPFEEIAYRPCIVLTARVHPGESNSSFVIQGVIDFLLEIDNPEAEILRKNYIFKIVPMLNPDGVINGNFRTSLIGKDLNRLWDDPRESICPTIFYTKEMIKKTLLSRDILLFCDFHGHSNKPNFFLYGCPGNKKIKVNSVFTIQENILSKMYSNINEIFDHKSCIYKIIAKKLKTARAVLKNEFNVDLSYCLESSIGYISIGEKKLDFFTPKIYDKVGRDFCSSVFELHDKNVFMEIANKIQNEEIKISQNVNSNGKNLNFYNNEEKKIKEKITIPNLKKLQVKEKNKDKFKNLNNNCDANSSQFEKEEMKKNNLDGILSDEKLRKKKTKLNPIKQPNKILLENSSLDNDINIPKNIKILKLNNSNNFNINLSVNNINQLVNGKLTQNKSSSNKSLLENSFGVNNQNSKLIASNIQIINNNNNIKINNNINSNFYSNTNLVKINKNNSSNNLGNINFMYKKPNAHSTSSTSLYNNNNINNTEEISERLKNVNLKVVDKFNKEKIIVKTNNVSAKLNYPANMKNEFIFSNFSNITKSYTDSIFSDKHLMRNNSITSMKQDKFSIFNSVNLLSNSLKINENVNSLQNSLKISKENVLYLNKITKRFNENN